MPELLLELGCEELPASFVRQAYQDLTDNIVNLCAENLLSYGKTTNFGTPRRLIVHISDLPSKQPDQTIEQRGPSEQAAYIDGQPSKALQGFCRGQGVDPADVQLKDGYIWITKNIPGKPTVDLLAELLPQAIKSLTFPKTMRWGQARMRFARPIRWILASLDDQLVSFEIETVKSGLQSRGHRFDFPEPFTATTLPQLLQELRQRHVEPDPTLREQSIRTQAAKVASGTPELPDTLVEENVFLTEWPTCHQGTFNPSFLDLPEAVLVTAMAKHQRFFPVRNEEGKVTNNFIAVRNSGEEASVRAGNEWVLNARFNDAQFFFDEDKQKTMDDFLADTSRMLFQEKLGTVRDRADRLATLAFQIAKSTGADQEEQDIAFQSGKYAKADLATGLVSELASLQGIIGGEYAWREDYNEHVAYAIFCQYDLAKNLPPTCIGSRNAVRLIITDQLDKLVGFLGINLIPKGSSDPFALRRAATLLIEAALASPELPSYQDLIPLAVQQYKDQNINIDPQQVTEALAEIFRGRYENLNPNVTHDTLEAATTTSNSILLNPKAIEARLKAIQEIAPNHALTQTLTRPLNILTAARKKDDFSLPESLDPNKLDSPEGVTLHQTLTSLNPDPMNAESLVQALKNLQDPINAFFDSTMIMAEDPTTRSHRLLLLTLTENLILQAGDFSKIVQEG